MQLQAEAVDPRCNGLFLCIIDILVSGNYYGKDFFANTWQIRPRESRSVYLDTVFIEPQFSLHAWAACSVRELWWKQVCRPPVGGWMCLQDRSRAASSSSWSPAAMAVTGTSSSAELMASDKCVMGELSGPEVHGSSFYERETLHDCLSVFLTDGLSYDYWCAQEAAKI